MHVGFEAAFQHRASYPDADLVQAELQYCLRAEELGFDSIWLTEHHFSNYGLIPDPLQTLSFLAGRTSRVQLGTAVLVLPWHDPVRMVEQIVLADHLSGGRIIAGVGRGLSADEFEGLRIPQEEARSRFNEYAQLLRTALETGVIEGGERTRQPRREIRPRPIKSFRGRLFSASVSPESAPLMAELELGVMFVIVKPPELIQADLMRYRRAWVEAHGIHNAPPQPILSAVVLVDESADRALELAQRYEQASHRVAVEHYGMAHPEFGTVKGYEYYRQLRATPEPPVNQPPATVIYGTPKQVLERFDDFKQRLDMQALLTIFHGIPHEDGERNLRCFVKQCLPELKSWPSQPTF